MEDLSISPGGTINLRAQSWKSISSLAGGFSFAFLLGEAVHELGHFLAHRWFRTPGVGIHLDPFGGSRITGVPDLPDALLGLTSAAGPLLNLVMSCAVYLALRKWQKPALLPFLLWAPVALVQEGVNLSLGLLSPGSDALQLVTTGLPSGLVLAAGVFSLAAGVILVSSLLDLAYLDPELPFGIRFLIMLIGISFLMLIRAGYASRLSPAAALENTIPLVFVLVLTLLAVGLQRPLFQNREAARQTQAAHQSWFPSILALILGGAAFLGSLGLG